LFFKIPELNQQNVRIKNIANIELILSNIIKDGKEQLQVICDFDRTISKYEHNGQKFSTSCAVLENSRFVTPDIRQKVLIIKLLVKLNPIILFFTSLMPCAILIYQLSWIHR
jgi:hypothetical protein